MDMRSLPVGEPSFREIVTNGMLYADKTGYISRMLKYRHCFLSRPRRFGKTLLVDTMQELFRGEEELFKGLEIASSGDGPSGAGNPPSGYRFESHPVARLSMRSFRGGDPADLEAYISGWARGEAASEGLKLTGTKPGLIVEELVRRLADKRGVGAVLLMDEYDRPITRHMGAPALANGNRQVLYDLFESLKEVKDWLRFTFVTGVTKYAMTSIGSGPNHLEDLSLDPDFAGVCGFTRSELEALFEDRLEATLKALKAKRELGSRATKAALRREILDWYDGYEWLGPERVLNPYSVVRFFDRQSFAPYWIRTGGTSHISALMRERPQDFTRPRLTGYASEELGKVSLGSMDPAPLLFHAGYLTIDGARSEAVRAGGRLRKGRGRIYGLRLPNREVGDNYDSELFKSVFGTSIERLGTLGPTLLNALSGEDSLAVAKCLGDLLSNITYHQHTGDERFYHGAFQSAFMVIGLDTQGEPVGSDGRADLALRLPGGKAVTVVELKCPDEPAGKTGEKGDAIQAHLDIGVKDALDAIKKKNYGGPFFAKFETVTGLGLAVCARRHVKAEFVRLRP
jgi:hypothetical protein